jgi:hypothetical protein
MSNNYDEDWRKVMLTQYSVFGTIVGLEVTALTIFVTLVGKYGIGLAEKIVFTTAAFFLFIAVVLALWMINQERRVAANDKMENFKKNERIYRGFLILDMIITWGLLLSLLLLRTWSL